MFKDIQFPPYTKNFYFAATSVFVVWMLFFDSNNMISQFQAWSKKNDLNNEKEYYLEKIAEVKEERRELFSQHRLIEKFAREKYLMKKETEDIYILQED